MLEFVNAPMNAPGSKDGKRLSDRSSVIRLMQPANVLGTRVLSELSLRSLGLSVRWRWTTYNNCRVFKLSKEWVAMVWMLLD